MVCKKSRRIFQTLMPLFLLSCSIFYSIKTIRKTFTGCKEISPAKHNKVSSAEILPSCTVCKKTDGGHFTQKLSWKKYVVLGELKPKKGILTVGYIHTEVCTKSENLERSLESIFLHLKTANKDDISVVILLRECSEITSFLNKLHMKYKYWIENNVLQAIKLPKDFLIRTNEPSQFWETFTSYTPEYIRKSKSLLRNIAFLWTFSVSQSDYFIQFTDHVTVRGDLMSSFRASSKNWSNTHWIWAENFNGFLTGRMYKTKSFKELVECLAIFSTYMPVNYILKFYQRNFRPSREVYAMSKPLPIHEYFEFNGDNPAADVSTSLVPGGGVSLQELYKNRKGYFWAFTPKNEDYILIDFKDFIQIKRVLIETGSHLYEDIFPGGVILMLFEDENMKTIPKTACHEKGKYVPLAEIKEPDVEISGSKISSKAVRCIKISVRTIKSEVFASWLIIRTIAVFTK